jgi:hypothetical protein
MKTHLSALLSAFFVLTLSSCQEKDRNLMVHYTFEGTGNNVVADMTGNGHDAVLQSGAVVKRIGKYDVMDLGGNDGFLDMGTGLGELLATLGDYSIATCLRIDTTATIRANGNFVWAFSTLEFCGATTGEYIAYRANQQRMEQSDGGYRNERVGIMPDRPAEKGVWHHVAYSQAGPVGTLYIDGEAVATGDAPLQPKDLSEPTRFNRLGRPPFENDVYLKAMYHDFRIYDKALSQEEIGILLTDLEGLNAAPR